MIQPVKPESKDQLQERFSLPPRAAIRVAALWKKGLGISEGVLEHVEEGNAFEQLLISTPLLEQADQLSSDTFNQLVNQDLEEHQIPPQPLTVDEDGNKPTLCLEEEQLAEDVWASDESDAESTTESTAGEKMDVPDAGNETAPDASLPSEAQEQQPILNEEESRDLFSEEQINELKLSVLTGVDPEKKIEALRKLALAPVDEQTQGLVFLNALTDSNSEVREQAAQCLEQLGLSEEISETIQTFLSGDAEQKRYAGEKLQKLLDDADNLEKAIAVALFTSELKSQEKPDLQNITIDLLTSLSEFIAQNAEEHLPDLTRNTIESLVSNFHDINESVRELYRKLGRSMPDRVYDILWDEATSVEERELRAYLLILLGELPSSDEQMEDVAQEMVETIRNWSDTEIECRRLGNALTQLGPPAIRSIIDQFSSTGAQQQVYLLRLLDEVLIDLEPTPGLQDKLEAFLLDITEIEDRRIREPLLDLQLLYHVSLSADTKKSLARLLMDPLQRFKNDRIGSMTPVVLEKMGRSIFPVMLEYLTDGTYPIQREVALQVLGSGFISIDPDDLDDSERASIRDQLDTFDQFLNERIEAASGEERSNMIMNQARALASPVSRKDRALEKMSELRDAIDRQQNPHAVLKGLGLLAASPLISEERAMKTGLSFLEYLDSDLPENISEEVETDTGRTLLVDRKTEIYTDLIPSVVDGLARICCRENLKDSFRHRICDRLLEKWNELVEFETVWAPGSITELAEHLGDICQCPHIDTDVKEDLLKGLSRRVNNLTVIDIIGDVLKSGIESQRIRELCRKITEALLEMLEMPDYQDPEDRRIILENLGHICSRKNLAGDRKQNKHLRIKVLDALFDGLYDQIDGVQQTLDTLSNHERVPKKYQGKIEKQLSKYRDTN